MSSSMTLTHTTLTFLLGLATVLGDGHLHSSCFTNEQECLEDFKKLLTDTDAFWFGSQYTTLCPDTGSSFGDSSSQFGDFGADDIPLCRNPDTNRKSVLSRLLKYDDVTQSAELEQYVAGLNLADVSYTTPSHDIYACDHNFTVPALDNYRIDPLSYTKVSQWSLDNTPLITWPFREGVKYTVIAWDVGYLFLHGLYINAVNGDMSTGQAVDKYHGPRFSGMFGNPYLVLVLEQTGTLNEDQVRGIMNSVLYSNNLQFSAPAFLAALPGQFTGPVAANLMNVMGDVYGAQRQRNWGFSDNCPLFVSQQEYLRNALAWAGIPAAWSYDYSDPSPEEREKGPAHLTSLKYAVRLVYTVPDIKFESCCAEYTFLKSMLIPDPFSKRPERPVQVRTEPRLDISPMNFNRLSLIGKLFTLIMVDLGAIQGPSTSQEYIIHWMRANIQGDEVTTGDTVIPYFGSNPFSRDSPRMYTFLLFEQSDRITDLSRVAYYTAGTCEDYKTSRCRYYVNSLIYDWALGDIKGVTWFLAEQDPFARQRIYREWAARSKAWACGGIRGFSEPCPAACEDFKDVRDHSPQTSASLLSVTLAAALTTGYLYRM